MCKMAIHKVEIMYKCKAFGGLIALTTCYTMMCAVAVSGMPSSQTTGGLILPCISS